MLVKVTTKHFKRATSFLSNSHCPLAEAIRNVLPNADICVGGDNVNIDDECNIPFKGWSEGHDEMTDKISEWIDKAKQGKRIKTVTVELIGYTPK